jgi:hypothetical protein
MLRKRKSMAWPGKDLERKTAPSHGKRKKWKQHEIIENFIGAIMFPFIPSLMTPPLQESSQGKQRFIHEFLGSSWNSLTLRDRRAVFIRFF